MIHVYTMDTGSILCCNNTPYQKRLSGEHCGKFAANSFQKTLNMQMRFAANLQFFMKSFRPTFGKQFFQEKFLANFRRITSYSGDFTAKSPDVRYRVATSSDFWRTPDTVFQRTKRCAASLPQTSPFVKGR